MKTEDLNQWLISEGRILGDEITIVQHYCATLCQLGVPLSRARIAQRYLNPLLSAWGVIWTPEETKRYTVASDVLATGAWLGSPFEHVVTTRTPVRKRLRDLDLDGAHAVYRELAAAGATDFYAMPLEYGDGSAQGCSFASTAADGFSTQDIRMIQGTRDALTAALEPLAMRESQKSLLRTYLGTGPAAEIGQGNIKRGEYKTVPAAILFADLRGFTAKSAAWPEAQLLDMMGAYFEMVVPPIQAHGGDVLKFMGDGILAIFQAEADQACRAATRAAQEALVNLAAYNAQADAQGAIAFVTGIDFGDVTFGNIGSPDRLDFTVVGQAVNVASRVQELCKTLDETVLVTAEVARHAGEQMRPAGVHRVRGVPDGVAVFAPVDG